MNKPTALITGASAGIGATYADRFARRGHNLVLVARDQDKMNALATRLKNEYEVSVELIKADLTQLNELKMVEARLRDDEKIEILVNNAGISLSGSFVDQSTDDIERIVSLNTISLVRLASAIAPRLAQAGKGSIINLGSVVGLIPEFGLSVYGATKAFVHFLSQGLSFELAPKGVYIQAVLPSATRTDLWERSGANINNLPPMMDVEVLVDAALAGFDLKETITIPPLQDVNQWQSFEAARHAMIPGFSQITPATRYLDNH